MIKSITPAELAQLLASNTNIQLVDVRERYEHDAFNIGGSLMPLSEITHHPEKIEKEIPVILYCRVGVRSQIAIQRLQAKYSFNNLINLEGGVEAWKKQFVV